MVELKSSVKTFFDHRAWYHPNVCPRNNRESIKSRFGVFVIGKKKARKIIDLSEAVYESYATASLKRLLLSTGEKWVKEFI